MSEKKRRKKKKNLLVKINNATSGRLEVFLENINELEKKYGNKIKLVAGGTVLVIGFSVAYSKGYEDGVNSVDRNIAVTTEYEMNREPVYDGIEYTVEAGETLSSIVARYSDDLDRRNDIIANICDENDIKYASSLQYGETISLSEVPESKLEEFGYSTDYSLFDPKIELEDRVNYLKQTYKNYSSGYYSNTNGIDAIDNYCDNFEKFYEEYKEYNYNPDEYLDSVLQNARELCFELKDTLGNDFDKHRQAYPLSQAINLENKALY